MKKYLLTIIILIIVGLLTVCCWLIYRDFYRGVKIYGNLQVVEVMYPEESNGAVGGVGYFFQQCSSESISLSLSEFALGKIKSNSEFNHMDMFSQKFVVVDDPIIINNQITDFNSIKEISGTCEN